MPLLHSPLSFHSRPILRWGYIRTTHDQILRTTTTYKPVLAKVKVANYATAVGHGGHGLGGKNSKGIPTLKQFILKTRVLGLYRDILRNLKSISNTNPTLKTELKTYARGEFERNRFIEEEAHVRYLLSIGEKEFEQMKRYILGG